MKRPAVTFASLYSREGISFGIMYLSAVLSKCERKTGLDGESGLAGRPAGGAGDEAAVAEEAAAEAAGEERKASPQRRDAAADEPDAELWNVICE